MSEMPDVLKLHADGSPDKHAVIVDASHGARSSVTTFARAQRAGEPARRTGSRRAGAQAGDRLVWCGPNSLEVLAAIHAARKAGLVAVPLSYRFNADEMQYVIDNSDATLVVVDAEQAPLVDAGPRPAPEGPGVRRLRRDRGAGELPPGWVVVGRRDRRRSPTTSRRRPTRPTSARR